MTEIYLFGSTFVLVFALGFQSLNVNGGHYALAFATSFAIGLSNLVLFKLVPQATLPEMAAYLSGGPIGIVASMWVHRRFVSRRRNREDPPLGVEAADAARVLEAEDRLLEAARAMRGYQPRGPRRHPAAPPPRRP